MCNCLEANQGNLIYQTDFVFLTGTNIAKVYKVPLSNFPILNKYLFKSRINIYRYKKKFIGLKYSFRILQTINRLNTWIKYSLIKQIQNTITEASERRLNTSRQCKCRMT